MKYIDHEVRIRPRQMGMSLVIVLIMLVIIGLTSAAAIRNATSSEQATNNIRMQSMAQQYAEAALRYCESVLALDDATRPVNSLKNVNIFNDSPASPGQALNTNWPPAGWSNPDTWTNANGGAYLSKTKVPLINLKTADSAYEPTDDQRPQCVVERSRLPDGTTATVVTARGFSPDYARKDANTELTKTGSVVWLQSTLLLN